MCCLLREVHRAHYIKLSGATVVVHCMSSTEVKQVHVLPPNLHGPDSNTVVVIVTDRTVCCGFAGFVFCAGY